MKGQNSTADSKQRGESVEAFINELISLARFCEYGGLKEGMIRTNLLSMWYCLYLEPTEQEFTQSSQSNDVGW